MAIETLEGHLGVFDDEALRLYCVRLAFETIAGTSGTNRTWTDDSCVEAADKMVKFVKDGTVPG